MPSQFHASDSEKLARGGFNFAGDNPAVASAIRPMTLAISPPFCAPVLGNAQKLTVGTSTSLTTKHRPSVISWPDEGVMLFDTNEAVLGLSPFEKASVVLLLLILAIFGPDSKINRVRRDR